MANRIDTRVFAGAVIRRPPVPPLSTLRDCAQRGGPDRISLFVEAPTPPAKVLVPWTEVYLRSAANALASRYGG